MSLRGLLLPFALLLAACGDSGGQDVIMAEPAAPALWEITDSAGAVEGWLFGTVHALPNGVEWETERLAAALSDADRLVVEVAALDERAVLAGAFTRVAFDEPVPPLAERVDPALRPAFDAMLAEAGIDADRFDALESWAAALTLAQLTQTANSGNGVDLALLRRFGEDEVVELEGAAGQLAIFDRLPERDQRDLLDAVIEESGDAERKAERLVEVWRSGDLEGLERLTGEGLLADPELYEALLAERNRAWANRIESLLAAGPKPFIAVGAGHMVGEDGLPAMLDARGFTVRRVQ